MKLNYINLNKIWCINFYNLQIFAFFKKSLPIPKAQRYSPMVSPKIILFLDLSNLNLQSIWSNLCLWNEVRMKTHFFFQQEYPGHAIPFIGKDHTYPTSSQCHLCHKSVDGRSMVFWILFFSRAHLYTLKLIPHCHNYYDYIMGLDSVLHYFWNLCIF